MKLGIDFGTTRTLVACADRGNYPVVGFLDEGGEASEHFPSVVAEVDGGLRYGFEAAAAARAGAPALRSFKRLLAAPDVTADTPVRIGRREAPLLSVLTGFLQALRRALLASSNLPVEPADDEALEAVVAVPAHAHAAQRFLTLEAFKGAGFLVRGMMNEPSAAGFEYTHRQRKTVTSKRTRIVVYDLGGGTFDASVVRVSTGEGGEHHDVLATAGANRLGGDDFDDVLARCALRAAGVDPASLDEVARARLLDACREAKERVTPNSKRIAVDAPFSVVVPVDAYYEEAAPLVEQTIDVMRPLLRHLDGGDSDGLDEIAGIYLVGGGSGLPLVPRVLKTAFGRRVHRSPYPAASVAIGLAIAADDAPGFTLTDRFSRSFGVFREQDGGRALAYDVIVAPDVVLPQSGVTVVTRRYRAAHNVGHFRFVECGAVDGAGAPRGDLVPFGEVRFPFDPALRDQDDLRRVTVERRERGPVIEERYLVDPNGIVQVEIEDVERGFARRFRLGGASA